MRLLLVLIICVISGVTSAQSKKVDKVLINTGIEQISVKRQPEKGGLFGLYKNHISDQILNDCIYDHSCSRFSHDVFSNLGLLKGLFLTADRLTRCNRASLAEFSATHIDEHGKAKDGWQDYVKDR